MRGGPGKRSVPLFLLFWAALLFAVFPAEGYAQSGGPLPSSGNGLVIIGVSSRCQDRNDSVDAALRDAARKLSFFNSVSGYAESRLRTGAGAFDFRASSDYRLSYDDNMEKYLKALEWDLPDVFESNNAVFVLTRAPGTVSMPPFRGHSATREKPSWVESPPSEINGFIAGVGIASRREDHGATVVLSYESAVITILEKANLRVRAEQIDFTDLSSAFGFDLVSSVETVSRGTLSHFYVVESWTDPATLSVYTLAVAEKMENTETAENIEKNAAPLVREDEAPFIRKLERLTKETAETEFTPLDAYILGRAAAARILQVYPLYTENPGLASYVALVCGALAVNSSGPGLYNGYHPAILDSGDFNAFATPGGHIFIARGFLEAVTSEDMLAAIIAHEMAHIQLGHGVTVVSHARLVKDLTALGNAAAAEAMKEIPSGERERIGRVFQESVTELIDVLLHNGYSQAQELEADAKAAAILAAAGYDPRALIDLLRVLERNTAWSHSRGFDSTHPPPAMRVSALEKLLNVFRVPDTRSSRQERFTRFWRAVR